MRKCLTLLGVTCLGTVAFVAGCLLMPPSSKIPRQVEEALDGPDKASSAPYSFIIYSLEPTTPGMQGAQPNGKETFHGHTILGQMEIKDTVTRRKLVAAFNHGVSDHDGSVAACFMPHHGIRVQQGKQTIDLVICFMCAQVKVYINGQEGETMLISTSPRATFNEVLDRARVPLSDKAR
jgi:hypothetical protein